MTSLCRCFLAADLRFCLQCTIALKTFCEIFYIKMINLKLRRETNTSCYESLLHAVFGFPIIWERCAVLTSWVCVSVVAPCCKDDIGPKDRTVPFMC